MPMRLGRLQRQSRRAFWASAASEVSTSKSPRSKSNGIYDVPTLLSGAKCYAALRLGS